MLGRLRFLILLLVIFIFLMRGLNHFGPGNLDDRTLHYAANFVNQLQPWGQDEGDLIRGIDAQLPELCNGSPKCVERTRLRFVGLKVYPLTSWLGRLIDKISYREAQVREHIVFVFSSAFLATKLLALLLVLFYFCRRSSKLLLSEQLAFLLSTFVVATGWIDVTAAMQALVQGIHSFSPKIASILNSSFPNSAGTIFGYVPRHNYPLLLIATIFAIDRGQVLWIVIFQIAAFTIHAFQYPLFAAVTMGLIAFKFMMDRFLFRLERPSWHYPALFVSLTLAIASFIFVKSITITPPNAMGASVLKTLPFGWSNVQSLFVLLLVVGIVAYILWKRKITHLLAWSSVLFILVRGLINVARQGVDPFSLHPLNELNYRSQEFFAFSIWTAWALLLSAMFVRFTVVRKSRTAWVLAGVLLFAFCIKPYKREYRSARERLPGGKENFLTVLNDKQLGPSETWTPLDEVAFNLQVAEALKKIRAAR